MNERYAGNAIFQKKYTRAELPRTVKRNHGERAMYYVSDSNAPIIPQNVFDRAQELRKRRTVSRSDEPKVYSGKIQCSCGSRCRAKTSNQIWYWSCVVHEEQRNACHIKQVPEETINAAFCRLYYKLKHHGNPIFTQMLSNLQKIRYSRMLWSEDVISLNKKISDILSQVQFLTQLQQMGGVDPDSERQFHIEADYFIDATGDGTVSAKAGVPFSVGNGNHETLGNSILNITPTICHILRRSSAAAGASSTNG